MQYSKKHTGRASSMPNGLLTGVAVSLGAIFVGAAVTAKLMDMEKLDESAVGYAVMAILLLASFLGSYVSGKRIKRQYLLVSGLSGAICIAVLLSITALFFGGQYEAVGVTVLLVLCGSMLAMLMETAPKRGKRRHHRSCVNR